MRYIIYGAGGIGGVVGGRLFGAGHEVVLICRGKHLEIVRDRGLELQEPSGTRQLSIPVAGHPREIQFGDGDVVVLTMKTQDTSAALDDLEACCGTGLPIVCCQNGVENERMASRRFAGVYGMLVVLPATFLEPGVVSGWADPVAGVLDVGCFPSGVDHLAERISADFTSAGFVCRADPAVMRLKYTKLLANLGNGLEAVSGVSGWDAKGKSKTIMHRVRQEALDCFSAAGIELASQEEYREQVSDRYKMAEVPGAKRGGGSTWQSLMRGSERVETDYLNGEIVLLGRLHGIPTPYNATLRRLSQQLAAEGGRPGRYTLADIEAMAEGSIAQPAGGT